MHLNNIRFKQLNYSIPLDSSQFEDIAVLVYQTDSFIYPAIFGDGKQGLNNAKRILPAVFRSHLDEMFSVNNLYVAILENEIVGLVLWYKGNLNWDCEVLKNTAKKQGILINIDNTKKVEKEYVSKCYNENEQQNNNRISIINVCVKESWRNQGIAKKLLESFIIIHRQEKMELTVLADNKSAISLYKKNGFNICSQEDGFSVFSKKPKCYVMERIIDASE